MMYIWMDRWMDAKVEEVDKEEKETSNEVGR
jgi:hypothetical protein